MTMKSEVKLEPCPLCQCPAELDQQRGYLGFPNGRLRKQVAIYCTSCGLDLALDPAEIDADPDAVEQDLVERWNTRPAILAMDRRASPPAEPDAWQRYADGFGWTPVLREDLDHYRSKGTPIRALYASPPAPAVADDWAMMDKLGLSKAFETYGAKLGWGLTPYQPECWAALDAAVDELVRRRSEPAPAVAVKPLEWNGAVADCPFGCYTVEERADDEWAFTFHCYPFGEAYSAHPDEASAKAAAQADYEQRIRSALVKPAPTVADDLPWRRKDIERGLILFRTSSNAHGSTNVSILSERVDALPQSAKDELAGMMRNIATGLSPAPAVTEPVYKAVERIISEHSAWIQPNREIAEKIAMSAVFAVHSIMTTEEQVEPAPAVAVPVGVEDLIERLLDAQQDINLAANEHMSQALCDASALIDEVETTLRKLAAAPQPPATERFAPTDEATRDQMAAVMLLHGAPDQQREAAEYAGVQPPATRSYEEGIKAASWQPIETAPKDGTDVILYCGPPDDPLLGVGYWTGGEDEQPGWYLWPVAAPFASPWPTHWAPIPAFPAIRSLADEPRHGE